MDDHEDRQQEVADLIGAAYTLMAKILGMLPIPISLPERIGGDWNGSDASAALIRSQALFMDLPIGEDTKILLTQMILDWQTAHTFGALDLLQPTDWRLDNAMYAIARLHAQAEIVTEQLTAEPDDPGEE